MKFQGASKPRTMTFDTRLYNPSPASYSLSIIMIARNMLATSDEHILLGDFNLHHPYWSGTTCMTQHAQADQLIDVLNDAVLVLKLFRGIITWKARGSTSIIDLMFRSENMANRLKRCKSRADLSQSSNYIPISTRLHLEFEPAIITRRRAWKLIDMNMAKSMARAHFVPYLLRTHVEIDEYTKRIQKYLQKIINAAVPWAKSSHQAKTVWNSECSEAMKQMRRLSRIWFNTQNLKDWRAYISSNDREKKIINKAKRLEFRQ